MRNTSPSKRTATAAWSQFVPAAPTDCIYWTVVVRSGAATATRHPAQSGHRCTRRAYASACRRASYAVAVARRDTTSHAWEGALPALLGVALLAAVAWFDAWGTNNAENWQAHYTGIFLLVFALGAIWAVAWAFLNRLFDTRLGFGRPADHRRLLPALLAVTGGARSVRLLAIAAAAGGLLPVSGARCHCRRCLFPHPDTATELPRAGAPRRSHGPGLARRPPGGVPVHKAADVRTDEATSIGCVHRLRG